MSPIFLYEIMVKNIERLNIMSIYYNASLNRNLRESRTILNKNKKRCNIQEFKDNLKKMISEKENKLKALKESINIRNSKLSKLKSGNYAFDKNEIEEKLSYKQNYFRFL